jgi:hypothetical protein
MAMPPNLPPVKSGISRDEIMKALARGYCQERNKDKEMDIDLIVAMADELQTLIEDEYGSVSTGEGH